MNSQGETARTCRNLAHLDGRSCLASRPYEVRSPALVIQITEIGSLLSHTERMDRRIILFSQPPEQNMNTRNDELSSPQNTVELTVVELDQVSGGPPAIG